MKNKTHQKTGLLYLPDLKQTLLFWCCLFGLFLSGIPQSFAQITGPATVCSGTAAVFNLSGTPNPSYTYTWSVLPAANSTILSSSPSSATIQWFNSTAATETVQVVIARPGLSPITWTKAVNIVPEPDPQISTNSKVACQGTEIDKEKRQETGVIIDDGVCIKVCANSSAEYTVLNGLPGSTFQWTTDLSKGSFSGPSTGTTVYINWYNNLGFTFVKVKETTTGGCVKEKTVCINIIESPEPVFSINGDIYDAAAGECFTGCTKANIQFGDLTPDPASSPIVSWLWDFGDGTYSSLQNPVHTYNSPGTYTASLVVTNQCGCKGYYKACLKVDDPENPPLEIYCPSIVCENAIAHYTIDNTCNAMFWEVNGGTIISSTLTSVDIMWDNVGPGGFGEIIANFEACGGSCGPKVTAKVPVIQANGFIEGRTVICYGKQYKYTLPQWPATNFKWSVIPAGAATLTSYPENSYEVNLVAYAPFTLHCEYVNTMELCAGKANLNINVVQPVTLTAPAKICTGTATSVVGTTPVTAGTSYTFINPSGSTVTSGTFNVAGTWTIQASNPAYCDITPISVQVLNPPAAATGISGELKVCLNTPYVYEVVSPIPNTLCNWSVTGGTILINSGNAVTVKWTSAGTKSLSVNRSWADIPGCNSLTKTINIITATPAASVSGNTSPCANTNAVYTATLSAGSSPIDNITWSLSNPAVGSVSSGQNTMTPTFTWNNTTAASTAANIIATMVKCGTTVTVNYPITVIGIPALSISAPASVCSGTPVTFTATTTPAGATVNWTLPPGSSPSTVPAGPTATVSFTNVGLANQNFTVTGTASAAGCTATATASKTIAVKPQPNINVSPGSGTSSTIKICPPASVTLLLSTNTTTSIKWFYNTSTTPYLTGATSSTVSAAGTYRVDVQNSFGCKSSITRNVVHDCDPACTLPSGAGIASKSHAITSCTNASGAATANIYFNGIMGSYLSGPPPVVTSLSVTGTTSSFNLPAPVIAYPNVSLTGATATKPGKYPVTLKICYQTSGAPCCTLVTEDVIIPVIADFDYTVNCTGSGYTLSLNNQSPILSGYTLSTQTWNTTGSGPSSSSSSIDLGLYTPGSTLTMTNTVTVNGPGGPYTCSRTRTLIVPAVPSPAFTITTTDPLGPGTSSCGIREVLFTGTTPGISKWSWNFGDGASYISSTSNLASRTYTNPSATYSTNVTLTIQDAYGCTFSTNKPLQIRKNTLAANTTNTYTAAEDIKCQGSASAVNLASLSGGTTPYSYAWYNEEILLSGYSGNPVNVTQEGLYWSMVTDARGCRLSANPTPAKRAFQPLPDVAITGEHDFCPNEAITLSAANGTITGITFLWQRLIGSSWTTVGSAAILSIPGGHTPGVYQYRVTATQTLPLPYTGSCTAVSPVFTITVHGNPATPYISAPVAIDCPSYSIQLDVASPAPGESYNWSNGLSGTSTVVNHGGPYRVWASNAWGCTSYSDIDVPMEPSYYFWRFPYGCYDYCREELPRRVDGPSYQIFNQWKWLIGGGGLPYPNGSWASGNTYTPVDPLNINLDPTMGGDGNGPGDYSWFLENSLCAQTSHSMSVSLNEECCRIEANLKNFRCVIPPFSKHPVYYGEFYIGGGCPGGTYTIYAVDPATGLANGTVLPASGVYTGGPVSFSYTPLPGVTDVRFRIKVNCEGKECISQDIDVPLTQYPCREMDPCEIDREWEYFQCYRPADPYFAANVRVYNYTGCDPVSYTIMAIDPVTGMSNGSVSPASGSIPAGWYPVLFNYYPDPGVTAVKFVIILNCRDRVCYGELGAFDKLDDKEAHSCKKLEKITSENGTTEAGTKKTSMQIAPNPANSDVKISFDIPEWKQGDVYKIHILNLLGQTVAEHSIGSMQGSWQYNTLQLSSGTYLVRLVKDGGNVSVQRMMIAH